MSIINYKFYSDATYGKANCNTCSVANDVVTCIQCATGFYRDVKGNCVAVKRNVHPALSTVWTGCAAGFFLTGGLVVLDALIIAILAHR